MGDDPRSAPTTLASTSQKDVVQVWMSYTPGDRIAGKYQLIRTLDQGGMGVVWVAHHLGLDIHVALKLVRPEVESPENVERLLLEAQAAARLRHPAIVQVLDVGRTDEGDPFLVMELLEGESLSDVLRRELRLDVVTALRVILPISGALEAMHAKGIVHRDVKPNNIFLARDDAGRWQPKLIDFGLARLDDRSAAARITRRGALVGTPAYLSPERMQGDEAAPRDDVWALCVVLYAMVTGALPFEGETMVDLFTAVARSEPQTLAFHGVSDPALWDILQRGLNPRGARWASMRALGKALTHELLERGATRDIAGLALRLTVAGGTGQGSPAPPAPAAPTVPARRRSAAHDVTARSPRPPASDVPTVRVARPPAVEAPITRIAKPRAATPAATTLAAQGDVEAGAGRTSEGPPPPERLSVEQAADARPGARLTPAIALALVMVGVTLGFIAGVLVGRRSAAGAAVPATTATAPRL